MIIQTEALVLRVIKHADNRMIVEMFTRSQGRVSFAVPRSTSPKARLKRQYFIPLTLLSVVYNQRPGTSLQHLQDAAPLHPYISIPTHPGKLGIALFVSEFLTHALKGEEGDEMLFDYIADSLMWLDHCTEAFANFHIVFMLKLTQFLGFCPNLTDYTPGCCFDLRSACFCASAPIHQQFLRPEEAVVILSLMRLSYATMHLFRMSRVERQRLIEVIEQFYRLHLPSFPELRSPDVLGDLYK
ncbi:MAG: DNA repair protein RecO [Prevotella sp.]